MKNLPNQHIAIDPYITRITQYNTFDSRIFNSKAINQLINIYGTDFVVNGFYPIYSNYSNNMFEIILCGGIFVQDNIVIQIQDNINLLIDVSDYDLNNGYLIIHPNYSYLDKLDNNVKIILQYISNDGHYISPNGWKLDSDRLYFDIYKFNPHTSIFTQSSESFIRIKHKIYYYRGFNNNNLLSLNYNLIKHYQKYNIQSVDLDSLIHPISINSVLDSYTNLIAYNSNIINLNAQSIAIDSRYFGYGIILNDIDSEDIYNIYDFNGNIILEETVDVTNKIKKSKLMDIGPLPEFNKQQYELKSYNGNLVLEETTISENNICLLSD